MHPVFLQRGETTPTIPVTFVNAGSWRDIRDELDSRMRAFADACRFDPSPGRHLLLPSAEGNLAGVLFALEENDDPNKDLLRPGALCAALPSGAYRFANAAHDSRLAALAFALGSYRFSRYRKPDDKELKLELPGNVDGEDLLSENLPLIHAVGRAAARTPRLIDITWGNPKHPRITLIGKGVCFDTGGLDIKPESGMLNMKKDMGGAASMLALAHMLMDRRANIRLRVLIPAVENSISGTAFRPRDIYRSRKGLTVEIGNTDAEGRLILADAIALADEEKPELIADLATLTGAARVALGTDIPPFYTDDDGLASSLAHFAASESDPLWRMPLWYPYGQLLDSKVADINNISSASFGGSITAALFLRRFVTQANAWLHCDIYAWNQTSRPGRPEGAECQAARALYALLVSRYG